MDHDLKIIVHQPHDPSSSPSESSSDDPRTCQSRACHVLLRINWNAEGVPLRAEGALARRRRAVVSGLDAPIGAMRPSGAQRARRLADAREESHTSRSKHPSLWRRADSSTNNKLKARSWDREGFCTPPVLAGLRLRHGPFISV